MGSKAHLKFLLKDSFWYGISGTLSKSITFFITPFVTRVLTKDEFLTYDLLLVYSASFAGLIMLGQDAAIARFLHDDKENSYDKKTVLNTGFLNHIFLIILFFCAYSAFSSFISKLFFGTYIDTISEDLVYLAIATVPGQVILSYFTNIFKWSFKRNTYIIFTLGYSILYTGLLFFFLGYFSFQVEGAFFSALLASGILVILGIYIDKASFKDIININFKLSKQMLWYGLPFGIITIINILLPSIDRFFLLRTIRESNIAEYALSVKMASLFTLVTTSFSISFGPFAFSKWNETNSKNLFALIFRLYSFILGFLVLVFSFFGPLILKIMAPADYGGALKVFPILLFAWIFQGLFEITSIGIFYKRKSLLYLYSYLFTFIFLILSNTLLMQFGVFGASISVVIGRLCLMLFTWYFSNKFYKIPINIIHFLITLSLVLVGLIFYFYFQPLILLFYLPIYLFLGYSVLLNFDEKIYLFQFLSSIRKKLGLGIKF